MKIELDIYYAIRVIRGVKHAKQTREKVLTYVKKIDKDLQVDIFTRKFQELIKRHFIIIIIIIIITIITFIQYMKQVKNYKSLKNELFKPGKKNLMNGDKYI